MDYKERLSYIKHLKILNVKLNNELIYRNCGNNYPQNFIYFNLKELDHYIKTVNFSITDEEAEAELQLLKYNKRVLINKKIMENKLLDNKTKIK